MMSNCVWGRAASGRVRGMALAAGVLLCAARGLAAEVSHAGDTGPGSLRNAFRTVYYADTINIQPSVTSPIVITSALTNYDAAMKNTITATTGDPGVNGGAYYRYYSNYARPDRTKDPVADGLYVYERDWFRIYTTAANPLTIQGDAGITTGLIDMEVSLAWDGSRPNLGVIPDRGADSALYNQLHLDGVGGGYIFRDGNSQRNGMVQSDGTAGALNEYVAIRVLEDNGSNVELDIGDPKREMTRLVRMQGNGGAIGTSTIWFHKINKVDTDPDAYVANYGGGLKVLVDSRSEFYDNVAADYGGAIYTNFHYQRTGELQRGAVTINNAAHFEGNQAGLAGGAIFSRTGTITIASDSQFINNKVVVDVASMTQAATDAGVMRQMPVLVGGGAIASDAIWDKENVRQANWSGTEYANIVIGDYVTFSGNRVSVVSGAVGANGGAISNLGGATTIGTDAVFTGNGFDAGVSGYGGAIAGNNVTLGANALFDNNYASSFGGAIASAGSPSSVTLGDNAIFTNNKADSSGGGAISTQMTYFNGRATLTGNEAGGDGGAVSTVYAIFVGAATLEAGRQENILLEGNIADGSGGAINSNHIEAADATTERVRFQGTGVALRDNTAGLRGGAIATKDGIVTFADATDVEITGNQAGSHGGAIFVDNKGSIIFGNSVQITSNISGATGGSLYSTGNITLGDAVVMSGNHAGDYVGGMYAEGDIVVGDNFTLMNNLGEGLSGGVAGLKTSSGGAVYNKGAAEYGRGAWIVGNQSLTKTGAVLANGGGLWSNGLTLRGSTYVAGNVTQGSGGGIFLNGGMAGTVANSVFDATGGDIVFEDNLHGVTLDGSGAVVVGSGASNSVYLNGWVGLTLRGEDNIYFKDAISSEITTAGNGGNKLVVNMAGSGFVQFSDEVTENVLNATGVTDNIGVDVQSGQFRLVGGTSVFTLHYDPALDTRPVAQQTNPIFRVAEAGTLAGNGMLKAPQVDIYGTLDPDDIVYANSAPEEGAYNFQTGQWTTPRGISTDMGVQGTDYYGSLEITGNVNLIGGTLRVDIPSTVGEAHDYVEVTGDARFLLDEGLVNDPLLVDADDQLNVVNISERIASDNPYILMHADTMDAADLSNFDLVRINGEYYDNIRLTPRLDIVTSAGGGFDLIMEIDDVESNIYTYWNGVAAGGSAWNETDANWFDKWNREAASDTGDQVFRSGDYVIFNDAAGETLSVEVDAAGVTVAGMKIVSGDYAFTGEGAINSVANPTEIVGSMIDKNSLLYPVRRLWIEGGSASFATGVDFADGLLVGAGAQATVLTGGKLADAMDVTNNGNLSINLTAATDSYTWGNTLTGTGNLNMDGAGEMIISGNTSGFTGDLIMNGAGSVELDGVWGGDVRQNVGAGTFYGADGSIISGTAYFAGDVDPAGTLNIVGSGPTTFDGATIHATLGSSAIDTITVSSNVIFRDVNGKNSVNLLSDPGAATLAGNYVLLTAANITGASTFGDVTIDGKVIDARSDVTLQITSTQVSLNVVSFNNNMVMTWQGPVDNRAWGGNNWLDADTTAADADRIRYAIDRDHVIFDGAVSGNDRIVLENDVVVAKMDITGGVFNFSALDSATPVSIAGSDTAQALSAGDPNHIDTTDTSPTGMNSLNLSDAEATFGVGLDFKKINVDATSKLILTDGGVLANSAGSTAVANAGAVEFNIADSYNLRRAIAGGAVSKIGEGVLTITNGNTSTADFTQSVGTVAFDASSGTSGWGGKYTQEAGILRVSGGAATIAGPAAFQGQVTLAANGRLGLTSAADFTDATLLFDMTGRSTIDAAFINANGGVTFAGVNTIDLAGFTAATAPGEYLLLSSGGAFTGTKDDNFNSVLTLGGQPLSARFEVDLLVNEGGSGEIVLDVGTANANLDMIWNGPGANWTVDPNWIDSGDTGVTVFRDNDRVTFNGGGVAAVNVDAGVIVSGMRVEAGDYVFSGAGSITGDANLANVEGSRLAGVDGKLTVTGGSATISTGINFAAGAEVAGGKLTLGDNGDLNATAIEVGAAGKLTVERGANAGDYNWDSVVTGAGLFDVVSTGAGALVINMNLAASSATLTQSGGNLSLGANGVWGGGYSQTGGTLAAVTGARVMGDAGFTGGTVNIAAGQTLRIDGNADFAGSTLMLNLDTANPAGNVRINAGGAITLGGGNAIDIGNTNLADMALGQAYAIMTAGAGVTVATGDFRDFYANGTRITGRTQFEVAASGNTLNLTLNTLSGNMVLVWQGAADGNWTTAKWFDRPRTTTDPDEIDFLPQDYVVFDGTGAGRAVNIDNAAGVTVSGMAVENGNYTFNGPGVITGEADNYGGTRLDGVADGRFSVLGGSATINATLDFENGAYIEAGEMIVTDQGDLSDMAVQVEAGAKLRLSRANDYTWESLVTGAGELVKNGAGAMTIGAMHSASGATLAHATGKVILAGGAGAGQWGGAYRQDNAAVVLEAGDGSHIGGHADFIGTLDVLGQGRLTTGQDANFTDATVAVHAVAGNGANQINVTGAITLNGTNTFNLDDLTEDMVGDVYTIMTAGGGITENGDYIVAVDGGKIGNRSEVNVVSDGANLNLEVVSVNASLVMFWTGVAGGSWSAGSWTDNYDPETTNFMNRDYVVFDGNNVDAGRRTISVDSEVQVSQMEVGNGDFIFNGEGKIVGKDEYNGTKLDTEAVFGGLYVHNGSATVNTAMDFDNGVTVDPNGRVILADKGDLADMDINLTDASAQLIVNRGAESDPYEWRNVVAGDGRFIHEGAGEMFIDSDLSASNVTLTHRGGTVALEGGAVWGGGYELRPIGDATLLDVRGNATISGDAALAGRVHIGATLTVNGTADITDGIFIHDLDAAAPDANQLMANQITSGGNVTFDIGDWSKGEFILMTAGNGALSDSLLDSEVLWMGEELGRRNSGELSLSDDKTQLIFTASATNNYRLTWTGGQNSNWESSSRNWEGGDNRFVPGDAVTFDNTAPETRRTVTLRDDILVGQMTVGGDGDYIFQGDYGLVADASKTSGVSAAGGLTKIGTGSLAFRQTGGANFAGAVDIQSGTLTLGTDMTADRFVLDSDARLVFEGAIDANKSLNIASLTAGEIEINGTLVPTLTLGAINNMLGGDTVTGTVASATGGDGSLVITSGDSQLQGKTEFYDYIFARDGENIVLSVTQNTLDFSGNSDSVNTREWNDGIKEFIDAGGKFATDANGRPVDDFGRLIEQIRNSSSEEAGHLMDGANSLVAIAGMTMPNTARQAFGQWITGIASSPVDGGDLALSSEEANASYYGGASDEWHVTGEAIGAIGEMDDSHGDPGYDIKHYGAAIAFDRLVGDRARVGVSASASKTEFEWDGNGGEAKADNYSIAAFGRYEGYSGWFVYGHAMYGNSDTTSRRHISGLAAPVTAEGEYDSHWVNVNAMGGLDMALGNWLLLPSAGLNYMKTWTPSFTEKGAGALNFKYYDGSYDSLEAQLALDVRRLYYLESNLTLVPRLSLGLSYELMDSQYVLGTRMTGAYSAISFDSHAPEAGRLAASINLGMDIHVSDQVNFFVDYQGTIRSNSHLHAGNVGVKLRF